MTQCYMTGNIPLTFERHKPFLSLNGIPKLSNASSWYLLGLWFLHLTDIITV